MWAPKNLGLPLEKGKGSLEKVSKGPSGRPGAIHTLSERHQETVQRRHVGKHFYDQKY